MRIFLPLAQHFAKLAGARCGRRVEGISPEAAQCLEAYSWPGNVRELENAVERAVVLGEAEMILPEDLPEAVLETAGAPKLAGAFQASVWRCQTRFDCAGLDRGRRRLQGSGARARLASQFFVTTDPQSGAARPAEELRLHRRGAVKEALQTCDL